MSRGPSNQCVLRHKKTGAGKGCPHTGMLRQAASRHQHSVSAQTGTAASARSPRGRRMYTSRKRSATHAASAHVRPPAAWLRLKTTTSTAPRAAAACKASTRTRAPWGEHKGIQRNVTSCTQRAGEKGHRKVYTAHTRHRGDWYSKRVIRKHGLRCFSCAPFHQDAAACSAGPQTQRHNL